MIRNVKCGVTSLKPKTASITGYFGSGAETVSQGNQWCLVTMSVKNVTHESQTFDVGNLDAFAKTGKSLPLDSVAMAYAGTDTGYSIDPGTTKKVTGVFELKSDDSISKFKVHDTYDSRGVAVLDKRR